MQVDGKQYTYTDISGLNDLKLMARKNKDMALKEIAKQFESLFMNMMLKSMRDASMGDPIFDSNQSGMYRDMFDRQLALSLSKGQGMGLAKVLERQLAQQIPGISDKNKSNDTSENLIRTNFPDGNNIPQPLIPAQNSKPVQTNYKIAPAIVDRMDMTSKANTPQEKFIRQLWPMAVEAADELDTLPEVLISQAALETGWGKHVNKHRNGDSSYNLFNIKAGPDWEGKTVRKATIEFHNGVPVTEVAHFRAYDSYEESFRDYVDFLQSTDRYSGALENSSDPEKYIRGLQKAGYATDPQYSDKILNIIKREWPVFNETISRYESGDVNA